MLHNLRVTLAVLSLLATTFLFVDLSGVAHLFLGWIAKIQFLPALLALNVAVVVALVVITALLGRVYCSIICPLGILQDVFAFLGKKAKKNRYSFSPAHNVLRFSLLVTFVAAFLLGAGSLVALLAPYSSFGRIAQNLFQPLYLAINNLLALVAEHYGSYAFYSVDVWIRSIPTFVVASLSLIVLAVLSWRGGRTYCNTICPVGTLLGQVARFSLLAPVIDASKCVGCRLCERNCKAACIDVRGGLLIDGSRCVSCFECTRVCPKGAISFSLRRRPVAQIPSGSSAQGADVSRRGFLSVLGLAASGFVSAQKEKVVDGGLTVLDAKVPPSRQTPLVPAGAQSLRNFSRHCTGCQLCVAKCPNHVLRPQASLLSAMQPQMSFEHGYCRPECTVCSEVCPAGAIKPVSAPVKSSTHIGHAVWVHDLCIPIVDGVSCGNCARHCPAGAIDMVLSDPNDELSLRVPAVNEERCIGCGACEHLCPSRPLSAIFVEGHENHRVD